MVLKDTLKDSMNNYYNSKSDRVAWDNVQVKVCRSDFEKLGNELNAFSCSWNVVESRDLKTGPINKDHSAVAIKLTEKMPSHQKTFIANMPNLKTTSCILWVVMKNWK